MTKMAMVKILDQPAKVRPTWLERAYIAQIFKQ